MVTYVYDKQLKKVVEKGGDNFAFQHYIISDTMDRLKHPATGRYHDSKSKFRRDTQASGCIEVGNEKMETKRTPIDREKRRTVLREQLKDMTDSRAGEILSSLERQFRR